MFKRFALVFILCLFCFSCVCFAADAEPYQVGISSSSGLSLYFTSLDSHSSSTYYSTTPYANILCDIDIYSYSYAGHSFTYYFTVDDFNSSTTYYFSSYFLAHYVALYGLSNYSSLGLSSPGKIYIDSVSIQFRDSNGANLGYVSLTDYSSVSVNSGYDTIYCTIKNAPIMIPAETATCILWFNLSSHFVLNDAATVVSNFICCASNSDIVFLYSQNITLEQLDFSSAAIIDAINSGSSDIVNAIESEEDALVASIDSLEFGLTNTLYDVEDGIVTQIDTSTGEITDAIGNAVDTIDSWGADADKADSSEANSSIDELESYEGAVNSEFQSAFDNIDWSFDFLTNAAGVSVAAVYVMNWVSQFLGIDMIGTIALLGMTIGSVALLLGGIIFVSRRSGAGGGSSGTD